MVISECSTLLKDDFLRDKVEKISNKIEENDIETAYKTAQLLINYINMDFLQKKYNIIKLEDSQMSNILKIYLTREEELFRKNNYINNIYIDVSERRPCKEDVIELLYATEDICRSKKEKYGI